MPAALAVRGSELGVILQTFHFQYSDDQKDLINFQQVWLEAFWKKGLLPMQSTIRAIFNMQGHIELKAKCLEVDEKLMDRMTIWDMQGVVDRMED